jgi:Right handed beta helix region
MEEKERKGMFNLKRSLPVARLFVLALILTLFAAMAPGFGVVRAATVTVDSSAELMNALASAKPGDRIVLASGITFSGQFKATASGTASAPITLESADPSNKAVLKGNGTGSGYALQITGDYWNIRNVKVTNAQKGIMLDHANHNLLDAVEVYQIGDEGVHFRDGSSYNTLQNSYIHDTGKGQPGFGEGVYVGSDKGKWSTINPASDYNRVVNNTIGPNVTAEHIDIKEGSTGTVVSGNIFDGRGMTGDNYADSFIDVKGNDVTISSNVGYRNGNEVIADAFQVHQQVSGWGLNADFNGNTLYLDNASCYVVNAASGTSARAHNNIRSPKGNMYRGNVTQY